MFRKKDAEVYYINERSRSASEELASLFSYCIQKDGRMFRELVFLCIGSDRITGDSLGPLIGYQLSPYCSRVFHVYGTLDDPVHALNLPDRISYIHSRHPEALLVAIDASLGPCSRIGALSLHPYGLQPGSGVHKHLPHTGDISITGITNSESLHPYLALQTARLSTVIKMAEEVCECILSCLL